jgi:hypothetical protein
VKREAKAAVFPADVRPVTTVSSAFKKSKNAEVPAYVPASAQLLIVMVMLKALKR